MYLYRDVLNLSSPLEDAYIAPISLVAGKELRTSLVSTYFGISRYDLNSSIISFMSGVDDPGKCKKAGPSSPFSSSK